MVVVIRYFGGTLLGVSGLINAYKSAASMALQLTPIVKKPIETIYELQFDYTISNDVMRVLKKFGCSLLKQEMQLFCNFEIGISRQHASSCITSLEELRGIVLKKKSDS
jgi:putative IMPACT (imprinted ancient) family translation regulator